MIPEAKSNPLKRQTKIQWGNDLKGSFNTWFASNWLVIGLVISGAAAWSDLKGVVQDDHILLKGLVSNFEATAKETAAQRLDMTKTVSALSATSLEQTREIADMRRSVDDMTKVVYSLRGSNGK